MNEKLCERAFTECMTHELRVMGVQPQCADTLEDVAATMRVLSGPQRRQLRRAARDYARHTGTMAVRLTAPRPAAGILKDLAKILTAGIGTGISAAGVVNTVAPGLFNTLVGYLAGYLHGSGNANWLVQLGLVSLGVFSTPTITAAGILALGGVLGLVIALIVFAVRSVFRAAVRRRVASE